MTLPVAILAGGLATRMRPLTTSIPKSMIEVAGRPFVAHQLEFLKREGVTKVVMLVGYLGEQIEAFVGDGAGFGVGVSYCHDGDVLRGTGGALRAALPDLGSAFLVLYGDSYLDAPIAPIEREWRRSGMPALMTVFQNNDHFDRSNVVFTDGRIEVYDKAIRDPRMKHIDYGLGVVSEVAFAGAGPDPLDLAAIYRDLAQQGHLAGFAVEDRFFEIGTPQGLRETEERLVSRQQQKPLQ